MNHIWSIVKYLIGTALICLGTVLTVWLYSTPIDFGEGWWGLFTARAFVTLIAITFSTGVATYMWNKNVRFSVIKYTFVADVGAFLFGLWLASAFFGVPMDASYSFGVNAVMISKAIVVLLPVIAALIGIVTILIYKPDSFWYGLIQIGTIIGIVVVIGVYVSPTILAAI